MIKFMVIGAPRSGTAWASVWLNAYHDPLWDFFYEDMANHLSGSGICCTGLGMFPSWVNLQHCPKVILHRDPKEVNASLLAMGLPPVHPQLFHNLDQIEGLHVPWTDLFNEGGKIWEHVLGNDVHVWYNAWRHKQLKMLKITTDWKARAKAQSPAVRRRYAEAGVLLKF